MKKSVYLVSGDNVPTKLAVVAFELEHSTLLEIENRFLPNGPYNRLTPVRKGLIQLANPMFGRYDQAYFPGYDTFKGSSEPYSKGRESRPEDSEPGSLVTEQGPYMSRMAYLVAITRNDVTENLVMVWPQNDVLSAQEVAQAFGAEAPDGTTIDVKLIGSGTFLVVPEVAKQGFKVRVNEPFTY